MCIQSDSDDDDDGFIESFSFYWLLDHGRAGLPFYLGTLHFSLVFLQSRKRLEYMPFSIEFHCFHVVFLTIHDAYPRGRASAIHRLLSTAVGRQKSHVDGWALSHSFKV